MKPGKTSLELMKQLCKEIREDDGVDPREFKKREQKRNYARRDRQLCAEVRRCLDLVLPEIMIQSGISVCEVLSVNPAPDISRLMVVVGVDVEHLAVASQVLGLLKGRIRTDVAQAVHRKKAPDLSFEVVPSGEMFYGE